MTASSVVNSLLIEEGMSGGLKEIEKHIGNWRKRDAHYIMLGSLVTRFYAVWGKERVCHVTGMT